MFYIRKYCLKSCLCIGNIDCKILLNPATNIVCLFVYMYYICLYVYIFEQCSISLPTPISVHKGTIDIEILFHLVASESTI